MNVDESRRYDHSFTIEIDRVIDGADSFSGIPDFPVDDQYVPVSSTARDGSRCGRRQDDSRALIDCFPSPLRRVRVCHQPADKAQPFESLLRW